MVKELLKAADALSEYRRQLEVVPPPDGSVPSAPTAVIQDPDPLPTVACQQATRPRSPHRSSSELPVVFAPAGSGEVLAMPQPDWLFQHLTVSGPAEEIARFRAAAVGPGIIPWPPNFDQLEEDLFLMLMGESASTRELSAVGAHVLAERVRLVTQRRAEQSEQAAWRVPLDLHALLPVPADILDLGPDHPRSQRWLWTSWGTTRPLRHVAAVPAMKVEAASARPFFRLGFWSADWTPWAALRRLKVEWNALTFHIQPFYDAD